MCAATASLSITKKQAQKLILLSQGFHQGFSQKTNASGTQIALENLGYVQIDSISVIARAHHHTLWNRVKDYHSEFLTQLVSQKKAFEYWSHAAAYLPMKDYRFSLPQKRAIAQGKKHWFEKDQKLMKRVYDRIKAEGPLQAKDFTESSSRNTGWWDWKPAKKALEQLFMQGELMVVERRGFQKVYDLTERVLPANIDTCVPRQEEYLQHLIVKYLSANAVAKPANISYLLAGQSNAIKRCCADMLFDGRLIRLTIENEEHIALPTIEELFRKRLNQTAVKILSPFDNLLIQRKRTKELFDFDYQIECYLPQEKRKFGYFSLPLLWGQNFAGRIDIKVDRKNAVLRINHLHIESSQVESIFQALKPSLLKFTSFNQCKSIELDRLTMANRGVDKLKQRQLCMQLIEQ